MKTTGRARRHCWSIAICGMNSATEYSGGRYHAWMMSEALASLGHRVTYWTDHHPVFLRDFTAMPAHREITIHQSVGFDKVPPGPFDLVVLTPHLGPPRSFFSKVLMLARRDAAQLLLINFESPNWFNALSPEPRDPALWRGWLDASRACDLVLSSTGEGEHFARQYYGPQRRYLYCSPSINSAAADLAEEVGRQRQVLCITRLSPGQRHKGARDLLQALGPCMQGSTLVLMIGSGPVDDATIRAIEERARSFDIRLRILSRPTDREKFEEIKRSSLMLFLSHFEGFGYPPIEAQYCDTPCIVYDLPVLREVSGDGLIYVSPGDPLMLQREVGRVLSGEYASPFSLQAGIRSIASFETYAGRLEQILDDLEASRHQPRCRRSISPGYWWHHRVGARLPDRAALQSRFAIRRRAKKLAEFFRPPPGGDRMD